MFNLTPKIIQLLVLSVWWNCSQATILLLYDSVKKQSGDLQIKKKKGKVRPLLPFSPLKPSENYKKIVPYRLLNCQWNSKTATIWMLKMRNNFRPTIEDMKAACPTRQASCSILTSWWHTWKFNYVTWSWVCIKWRENKIRRDMIWHLCGSSVSADLGK